MSGGTALVPELRFPEFEGGWKPTPFSQLLDRTSEPVEVEANTIYREIGVRSHGRGLFHKDPTAGREIGNKRVFHVAPDALVLNIVFAWEQAVALTSKDEIGFIASHRFPMFLEKEGQSYLPFMLRLLLTQRGKALLEMASPGGAGRNKTLGQDAFLKLKATVPRRPEQQKIAAFLDAVSKKVALLTEKRDGLVAYKRGVMQRLFSGALRFTRPDGSAFPDWEYFSLGDLEAQGNVELGRGQVISKADLRAHPGNYPVYSSSGVDDGEFGRYGKWMFDEELITWSIDGGGRFFHRKCGKFSITNVSGFLRILNSEPNYGYLYSALSFLHQRLVFDYQLKAHPSVIIKLYKRIPIPHPDEQTKIAEALSALDTKIDAVSAEISQMETFKKGLLQKMFV